MKRTIIFLLALTIGIALQAQTFTVDGISYERINDSICEVRGTSLVDCVIPPYVTYNSASYKVTKIWASGANNGAFRGNAIHSVSIPYTINTISPYAFNGCSSLTTIIYNAKEVNYTSSLAIFYNCPNITSVIIGDSVKTLPGYFMWGNTNLTELQIPNNVEQIGSCAFRDCVGLSSISLSNNLRIIGDYAFYDCTGLFEIVIPDSVRMIGANAFAKDSNLYSLTIGRSIEFFGVTAFAQCASLHNVTYNARNASYLSNSFLFGGSNSISNLTIGSEVESIPPYFMSSKPNIRYVVFPEGLTHIGNNAFYNCGLEELVIPSTVTNIGQNAFYNNTNISRIVSLPNIPPAIYQSTFSGIPDNVETVVPCGDNSEYSIRPWWNRMTNVKETCRYSTVYDTICGGTVYEYGTHTASVAGTYYDTIHIDQYVDSMITIHLVVNPSYDYTHTAQICDGQAYFSNGFNESENGFYIHNFQSIYGCDSIVRLNLTVHTVYDTTISASICHGDTYSQYGFSISTSGSYAQNLSTIAGCDSIVHLQLSVNPTYSEHLSATISDEQSYQLGDCSLNQPGVYQKLMHTQAGCDSLLTLTLTVIPSIDTLVVHDTVYYPDTIIVTDTMFIHDTTIVHDTAIVVDTMIVYADTLVIRDTVFITDTIVPCPTYRTYIHASVEQGGTYTDYGFNVSVPGVYCDTMQTAEGCDSIICLFLAQSVGIDEVGDVQVVSIYPNPTRTALFLSVPEGNDDRLVNIIDNTGKTVISQTLNSGENRIDVSVLSVGVYYLKVGKLTSKLIIQ